MDEINETSEANEAIEYDDTEEINAISLNMASRWKRLAGAIIDGIVSGMIMVIIMYQMGLLQKTFERVPFTISEKIYIFIIGWLIFLVIQGYLLFKRGQTIGKALVSTKIVDLNGNIPNFGKIFFLRYFIFGLIGQIPFVGGLFNIADVLFIFGAERRCIHDYLAGTVVINESNAAT